MDRWLQSPLRVHAQIQPRGDPDRARLRQPAAEAQQSHAGCASGRRAQTDAFLVTLRKSEADFSPTTMYRDYAISPTLFHWESQSTTSVTSPTGRRYLRHRTEGTNVLIFVRDQQTDDLGAAPYLLLGSADYVSHTRRSPDRDHMEATHTDASRVVSGRLGCRQLNRRILPLGRARAGEILRRCIGTEDPI